MKYFGLGKTKNGHRLRDGTHSYLQFFGVS
jgi:hypothetical protein